MKLRSLHHTNLIMILAVSFFATLLLTVIGMPDKDEEEVPTVVEEVTE